MSQGAERPEALRGRPSSDGPVLIVVLGPTGPAKTTFVETFLRTTGLRIVNPDQIARALSPAASDTVAYEAARLADTVRGTWCRGEVRFAWRRILRPEGTKMASLRERIVRREAVVCLGGRLLRR